MLSQELASLLIQETVHSLSGPGILSPHLSEP